MSEAPAFKDRLFDQRGWRRGLLWDDAVLAKNLVPGIVS
jgi:hypothetical protein